MGELIRKDLEGVRGWRYVSVLATGIAGSEAGFNTINRTAAVSY
jgi:hypothetical protein